MRLGIVGCGAIGTELAKFAADQPEIRQIVLFDQVPERASQLSKAVARSKTTSSGENLIQASDLVVECASQDAARLFLPLAVAAGKNVMCLSVGAFVDDKFREKLTDAARQKGVKIYLPSGAICGVDGLKAAALARVRSVTLVTTKPPAALGLKTDQWTIVFEGSARDAVKKFPQNVNVAAALSLAGIGFDATRVQVVADPLATRNNHKVIFEGDFGRVRLEVDNLASPGNPKTSYMASLSAMATLRRILDPIQLSA
ncbi:MAG TPA: aspartate dehydrogenase [Candidatus Thermoplasmatota archaeon]|nr:aspartate dehydrogenase [Candidatus Thermoplasmatota archaeon]